MAAQDATDSYSDQLFLVGSLMARLRTRDTYKEHFYIRSD